MIDRSPAMRLPTAGILAVLLLVAGLALPGANPVLCVGAEHRSMEGLLAGCCNPLPPGPGHGSDALSVRDRCDHCRDLLLLDGVAPAAGPGTVAAAVIPGERMPASPRAAVAPRGAAHHLRPVLSSLASVVLIS